MKNELTRRAFAAGTLGLAGYALNAQQFYAASGIRPPAGSVPENLPDGSTGRISEFRGADGTMIACYVRRPKGQGPFPAVVLLHQPPF